MKPVYLEKHSEREISVLKITSELIEIAVLKVATWSNATITESILEYIPKSNALEFLVKVESIPIRPGDEPREVIESFKSDEFVESNYYRFAQIQAHDVETPDNIN